MKYDLTLSAPLLNAAGSLGFTPEPHSMLDFSGLGAFITNPISLRPRSPAAGTRLLTFPGGYLLHTGFPNPGLNRILRTYASRWARAPLPIWVHLLAEHPHEVTEMVKRVESVPGVGAVELGIHPAEDETAVRTTVTAAIGELPLIVRLPLERAAQLAFALNDLPIAALSLGPPQGLLPDAEKSLVSGRLYGPSIFPYALKVLQEIVRSGIPAIAAGGIITNQQIETILAAGALAVQLDAILWCGKIPATSIPSPER
ncbi:MAG: nitronate monooxygenase [Anaerolineales bacterium]